MRIKIISLLLVGGLAVGLAACGSSTTTSTTGSVNSAGSSAARYQARLNLAKCLRSHGVNVPDPSAGGGGAGGGTFRALRTYPQSQVRAAMQSCQQYLRQSFAFANLTPAQIAQFRQEFVKFAECMRSHGVNVPDPGTTGAGGFGFRRALGSVNRSSPAFQAAATACQSLRPRFGGGGPGGAVADGPGGGPGG